MFAKTGIADSERLETLLEGYRNVALDAASQKQKKKNREVLFERLEQELRYAGLNEEERSKVYKRIIAELTIVSLGSLAFGSVVVFLIGIFLLFCIENFQCSRKVKKRSEAFEKDYTALLLSLASSVRTGMDPVFALSQSDELFAKESVVAKEVQRFRRAIEEGVSEAEAIHAFADTVKQPDIDLFRTAFLLARREGSSIGECLQRLARVTRQRQSFRRKVRSAVAMQKMSAIGIVCCALAIGVFQVVTNPKVFGMALEHPVGSKLILGSISCMGLGLFWMLRMAKAKV